MKRITPVLLVLLSLLAALLGPTTASAASVPPLGYHGIRPAAYGGPGCDGGRESDCPFNVAVKALIDQTPCPAQVGRPVKIRIDFYSLTYPGTGDSAVAKAKCGVNVGIVSWYEKDAKNHEKPLTKYLTKLKTDMQGVKGSWIKFCHDSCMSSKKDSDNHEKVAAFSETGGRKNVWLSSSNNTAYAGDRDGWGSYVTGSDPHLFAAVVGYIDASRADKTQTACRFDATSVDRTQRLEFYPCTTHDPVTELLRAAKPTKSCTVDHGFFYLSSYAAEDTRNLNRLQAGCRVRLTMNYGGKWSLPQARIFLHTVHDRQVRHLVPGELRDASYLPSHPDSGVYMHDKELVLRDVLIGGKKTSVVVTGSRTRTKTARSTNTNVDLVDYSPATVRAAAAHADLRWSYSRPLTWEALCRADSKGKRPSGC